ncbi:hypothetical protein SDRG_04314 [Saprolegnia diclina VS20]|uniref:Uncharacterized protein n=1 Tax=Saprolegnia diclina (strain VS20) TaxID=1156394 RepID=T0S0Y7_SAPDV|nr:hypothetical protein SDRG_04314 [Saprolegnia diclina VS20]EQC38613.1 hypothetical protein SDRG_04314 [Saprolegnia diclina VS20]|eukprot:XP_008608205.1 hypothetical protein SDRG_04314 [Saprolegnia diclina VS20]
MNRALANPANLQVELRHVGRIVAPLATWAAPLGAIVAWCAWPGLTPEFKEESLGIKQAPAHGSIAAAANLRPSSKYKYIKNEIGERPSLDDE